MGVLDMLNECGGGGIPGGFPGIFAPILANINLNISDSLMFGGKLGGNIGGITFDFGDKSGWFWDDLFNNGDTEVAGGWFKLLDNCGGIPICGGCVAIGGMRLWCGGGGPSPGKGGTNPGGKCGGIPGRLAPGGPRPYLSMSCLNLSIDINCWAAAVIAASVAKCCGNIDGPSFSFIFICEDEATDELDVFKGERDLDRDRGLLILLELLFELLDGL